MSDVVAVAVWALAVARVVRLVNLDVVFDPVRVWVARRAASAGVAAGEWERAGMVKTAVDARRREARWNLLAYYLGCPWCVGLWVAAGSAWIPLWHAGNPVARYVGIVLAGSLVVGLLARLANDEDVDTVEVVTDDGGGDSRAADPQA